MKGNLSALLSDLLRLASLYDLERYLFETVSARFAEAGTLTPDDESPRLYNPRRMVYPCPARTAHHSRRRRCRFATKFSPAGSAP